MFTGRPGIFDLSAMTPIAAVAGSLALSSTRSAEHLGRALVSAVIPTYNRGHVIQRAIESVSRQTYEPIEIIVVDDGSTDDTAMRIARMSVPGLRFYRSSENKGASAARNLGISQARGDFIAFLDADDEWLPEKTARQVAKFEKGPVTLGVVYSGYRAVSPHWPPMDRYPKHRGELFETLRVANVIRTSGAMVRRQVLDDVGGFDCGLPACEDLDLWLKIARKYSIDYIPEIAVQYHFGAVDQLSYRSRAVFLGNATIFKRYNSGTRSRAALGTYLALQARELLALGKRRLAVRYAIRSLTMQPSHPVALRVLKQFVKHRIAGIRVPSL